MNTSREVRISVEKGKLYDIADFQARITAVQNASKNGFVMLFVHTHKRSVETVIGGYSVIGTTAIGAPILGSVELTVPQDEFNAMPPETQCIVFKRFGAWAVEEQRGALMPRLQYMYNSFSRMFAVKPAIAHRCLRTSHISKHFCRYFGANHHGVLPSHAYRRFKSPFCSVKLFTTSAHSQNRAALDAEPAPAAWHVYNATTNLYPYMTSNHIIFLNYITLQIRLRCAQNSNRNAARFGLGGHQLAHTAQGPVYMLPTHHNTSAGIVHYVPA